MNVVNNWRKSQGYQTYTVNNSICRIADDRVSDQPDLASYDNHDGLFEKYRNYPSVISENIIGGVTTESEALKSWLASPAHRAALERNYTYSCISCKYNTCVQIFSSCENGCP